MARFSVKPKWLQIISQSWDVWIGFWWMKVSRALWSLVMLLMQPPKWMKPDERRWRLGIYYVPMRKNDSRDKARARWWGLCIKDGRVPVRGRVKSHIWQEEGGGSKDCSLKLPRTMTRYCAEGEQFYSWEMKLESSLDRNKTYLFTGATEWKEL